jgi:MAP3K TRAFs-binding domain
MEIKKKPDPRRINLIPLVKYSVEQKMAKVKPDYWDYATLLELAILAKDKESSFKLLSKLLIHLREEWEGETTLRTLRTIREAREKRNERISWTKKIEESIQEKTK